MSPKARRRTRSHHWRPEPKNGVVLDFAPEKVRPCLAKRRYASEAVARAIGQQSLSSPNVTLTKLFTYHCSNCRGWHLTKNPWKNGAPITATSIYEASPE